MINLPNVTLIAVATADPYTAAEALKYSCRGITFGAVKLVSHYEPDNLNKANYGCVIGEQPMQRIQYEPLQRKFSSVKEWNEYIFYNLHKHFETSHCLLIHEDGFIVRPELWDNDWMQYDFVGAPIPSGGMNSVSLRSRKLCEYKGELVGNEDVCLSTLPGFNYPDMDTAYRFSSECAGGVESFAFHKYHYPGHPNWDLPRLKEGKILKDTYAGYVNLKHREDREQGMRSALSGVGINAVRHEGISTKGEEWNREPYKTMYKRTPGAIGCMLSQMEVMKAAKKEGKHALVMEDDLIFCDDFHYRLRLMTDVLRGTDWDIMWLGGTYHKEPTWHTSGHPQLPLCGCNLERDYENAFTDYIVRTYGCWSTYAYIVNHKSLYKILWMLDQWMPQSIGIDYSMILMQPMLKTYAFNPGMVIQKDNQSDIGNGVTKFSGFAKLGAHYWKEKL